MHIMNSIGKWPAVLLVAWTATAGAQNVDPSLILLQAEKSLKERQNISARFEGRYAIVQSVVPDEVGHVNMSVTGNFLMSGGRHRCQMNCYYTDGDGTVQQRAWERISVFGKQYKNLNRLDPDGSVENRGHINSQSNGYFMAGGTWMLTGSIDLFKEADCDYVLKSVFRNMLEQSVGDSLQACQELHQDRTLIRVEEMLPFGLCTVWIDPERDYNMVKFRVEMATSDQSFPHITVESGMIGLIQIEDKWIPESASYTKTIEVHNDPRVGSGELVYQADIHLHDIKFVSDSEPEHLFDLEFPPDTFVYNNILDIEYYAEDPDKHPVEYLVSELISKSKLARAESGSMADEVPQGPTDEDVPSLVMGESRDIFKGSQKAWNVAYLYVFFALLGGVMVIGTVLTYRMVRQRFQGL